MSTRSKAGVSAELLPSVKPRVELICVGSELLNGRLNTHQSYLAVSLLKTSLSITRASSLPDDIKIVRSEIIAALRRCDVLLISGGLGPTFDDVTREAAASALKRRLIYRPELFSRIEKKFARYRLPVPEENKRQAFVIDGAEVLENKHGSAPGQLVKIGRGSDPVQTLVLMPGPFKELSPMFEATVLPRLKKAYAGKLFVESRSLHLLGISESAADEKLQPILAQAGPGLEFTILASLGQVDFYARATASKRAEAGAVIGRVLTQAKELLGKHIFSEGGKTLEEAVGRRLLKKRATLSVAESCTGGLLGSRLTSAPGSSRYFKGGAIAYSNDLKTLLLKVHPKTLESRGAVSAPCAAEMAAGVRRACKTTLGISITGIAGPGGGTKEKPVGLVFIAIAGTAAKPRLWRFHFSGDRDSVRQRAASAALYLLFKHLGQPA